MYNKTYFAFFSSAIAWIISPDLKTALPATRTSAPQSTNCLAFLELTPPSTSISAEDFDAVIRSFSSLIL